MRVIVVGPSGPGTKGGISSVMGGMQADEWLTSKTDMAFYGSYYDGNLLLKILYGVWRILWFNFVVGRYDIVHIHMSIKGSAKRKMQYAKIAKRHGKKVILHPQRQLCAVLSGTAARSAEKAVGLPAERGLCAGALPRVEAHV